MEVIFTNVYFILFYLFIAFMSENNKILFAMVRQNVCTFFLSTECLQCIFILPVLISKI